MAKIGWNLRLTTSLAIGVPILMKRVIWIDIFKLNLNQRTLFSKEVFIMAKETIVHLSDLHIGLDEKESLRRKFKRIPTLSERISTECVWGWPKSSWLTNKPFLCSCWIKFLLAIQQHLAVKIGLFAWFPYTVKYEKDSNFLRRCYATDEKQIWKPRAVGFWAPGHGTTTTIGLCWAREEEPMDRRNPSDQGDWMMVWMPMRRSSTVPRVNIYPLPHTPSFAFDHEGITWKV